VSRIRSRHIQNGVLAKIYCANSGALIEGGGNYNDLYGSRGMNNVLGRLKGKLYSRKAGQVKIERDVLLWAA